ncbi:hypothetical protein [Dactylosporangium matsuzakiense]|uniref:Uncharacterized protein n=1 Tax=Dactylosporangium matsuzakiense TaxID=53360 RepID=A0A9W6KPG3_9ACTN|nr:hypothetical protein [Dactylosporangium matsuzakiense]UWZ40930.1 hypothetical protein Dmats_24690 [Dactylosporangium matsuzakiense]GLL04867.1 hypothetical protein GCM10017581_066140 [Dactylosporangium matsuzakiense]
MRTEFDAAIGVVPASPIDVDRLIARGRRRAVVRRVTAIGAGSGVAAVAVGVAIAAGGSSPVTNAPAAVGKPSVSPVPRSPSASPSPVPVPSGRGSTPAGQASATAGHLSQAVKDVVRDRAPGYTLSAGEDGPPFAMHYVFMSGGNDSYYGSAYLKGPTGEGNVVLNVGRRSTDWHPMNPCWPTGETGPCTQTVEPGGAVVLRREIHENGIADNYVIVDRPDGITIFIVSANQGGQTDSGPGKQAAPVLPFDTLVAIAQDPRLTV